MPVLKRYGYKTASGRANWPSRDPIGEDGGNNLYAMLQNNPVNGFDPSGMEPWTNGKLVAPRWSPSPQDWSRSWKDFFLYGDAGAQAALLQPWVSREAALLANWYLNGNGGTYQIDFVKYITDNQMTQTLANDLNDAVQFSVNQDASGDIKSQQFTDFFSRDIKWFYAVGTVHWAGSGTLSKDGNNRSLKVNYLLWDPYVFRNDNALFAGLGLTDADWFRLHKVGLAREFLVVGYTATITLKWCDHPKRRVQLSELDFAKEPTIDLNK